MFKRRFMGSSYAEVVNDPYYYPEKHHNIITVEKLDEAIQDGHSYKIEKLNIVMSTLTKKTQSKKLLQHGFTAHSTGKGTLKTDTESLNDLKAKLITTGYGYSTEEMAFVSPGFKHPHQAKESIPTGLEAYTSEEIGTAIKIGQKYKHHTTSPKMGYEGTLLPAQEKTPSADTIFPAPMVS